MSANKRRDVLKASATLATGAAFWTQMNGPTTAPVASVETC